MVVLPSSLSNSSAVKSHYVQPSALLLETQPDSNAQFGRGRSEQLNSFWKPGTACLVYLEQFSNNYQQGFKTKAMKLVPRCVYIISSQPF